MDLTPLVQVKAVFHIQFVLVKYKPIALLDTAVDLLSRPRSKILVSTTTTLIIISSTAFKSYLAILLRLIKLRMPKSIPLQKAKQGVFLTILHRRVSQWYFADLEKVVTFVVSCLIFK